MPTLSKDLRRTLENVVVEARQIAEAGAEQALKQLAVHHSEPWPTMSPDEKALREKLRAHGRQLGDRREANRTQEIPRLKQACAYEHWHRMLFARFLAENNLLIHPDYGESISLDEIRELARDQNVDWLAIAVSFAQQMLIEVFRPTDPVLDLLLPPETRQRLENKLASLAREVFTADDSLGWVYQFWQSEEKDSVNKKEIKIGADELPPVTQLFTEDYMVLFLLHNTLGAWWTAKRQAGGQDPSLPGYDWTYLRTLDDGTPVAGRFEGWPLAARNLRILDPSMGSGHFLTFALPILTKMRQEEEGLSLSDAIAAVLGENLFGLELDPRCSQIAAFNLALSAWRLAGAHFRLGQLNLACSGLGINSSETTWTQLAGDDKLGARTMQKLYELFQQAPTLGSLIDPARLGRELFSAEFAEVVPLLEEALSAEEVTEEERELAVAAKGLLAAARILSGRFTLVATNVPYLGRGSQHPILSKHCEDYFSDARADLATCFVERCLRFSMDGGSIAVVTKHELLFKPGYEELRKRLLSTVQWRFLARLGARAFETISGEIVNVVLLGMTRHSPAQGQTFAGLDVSDLENPVTKAEGLLSRLPSTSSQKAQLANPESRIVVGESVKSYLLGKYATFNNGLQTGDYIRFARFFWELERISPRWRFFQSTVDRSAEFRGLKQVLLWEDGNGELAKTEAAVIRGRAAWGRKGIAVSAMGELRVALYSGELYDDNTVTLTPTNESHLAAMWCYCKSPRYYQDVRRIDQALKVRAPLVQVPFDLSHWQAVADKEYPQGLPAPYSADPTEWPFDGRPEKATHTLQVAVARLLGYRWPRQTGSSFPGCPALEPDELDRHIEPDGIVGLTSLAGEAPAADRLRALLADAYGSKWSASRLAELLDGCESLEVWLRDRFFTLHCEVFENRPIVWHVWDGRKDGFHAFVNYHRLAAGNGEGRRILEKLIYTSLGDWISRQKAEVASGVDGADARLASAQYLQWELEKILAGEAPYDIFARWKPIHEQPIGWAPDLDDGIRVNIRPWLNAQPASHNKPKKGACILRATPKITYGKDRGKEAARDETDFPWFAESTDRNNDLHFSLDEKRAARQRRKKQ